MHKKIAQVLLLYLKKKLMTRYHKKTKKNNDRQFSGIET